MLKKNKDNSETPEGRKARRPSFSPFKPRDKQPNFILSVLCHTVWCWSSGSAASAR